MLGEQIQRYRKQMEQTQQTLADILPIIGISYFQVQAYYPKQSGPQVLLIPKISGLGLTVNPNHPLGKLS